jgi:hypothetical protein
MKLKWKLYIDIYDTTTRQDLPPMDLGSGILAQESDLKDLMDLIGTLLPKDANYFKDPVATLRTTSVTLESRLCYTKDNENQRNSPALLLEPENPESVKIEQLQSIVEHFNPPVEGGAGA